MLATFLIGLGLGFAIGLRLYLTPKRPLFVKSCSCPDCLLGQQSERMK